MHLAAPRIMFTLPRVVHVADGLWHLASPAFAKWNAMRPGLFSLTAHPEDAQVFIVRGKITWVAMPLESERSTMFWGPEPPEREYWFAHELGHTLGLGDHVWPDFPGLDKYINPHIDYPDDPNRYRGVMSYLSPLEEWFGQHDQAGIRELFPLGHRVTVPAIARDEA